MTIETVRNTKKTRHMSQFWIDYAAGLVELSPVFAERDAEADLVHLAELVPMNAWLRLSEGDRADVIQDYAGSRPRPMRVTSDRRRSAA